MTSDREPFSARLAACECCPRRCGADRLAEEIGFCGIGAKIRVAHVGLHHGEEPPISGSRGSGTIFFAGCNLRCIFCQNYQISQCFDETGTRLLSVAELADEMLRLQDLGAHNINFVSPSHMVFQMANAIVDAKARGLAVPVVYNSNGYDSVGALRAIRGSVDIYLPDLKYFDADLAERFSMAADYPSVAPEALREMLDQVGHLQLDDEGIAVRGMLVRHLVLPGGVENSRRCLRLLADLSPQTHVSIMSQYSPQHRAREFPPFNRSLTANEYDEVVDYALELGLENAFVQELESQSHYLPDFGRDSPF